MAHQYRHGGFVHRDYMRLIDVLNASSVGCGCRVPFIAHSPNRALKPASSRRRLKYSRFDMLAVESCVCYWCLETRAERDAAADCPALRIRKMGPPMGDIHPRALRDTYYRHVCRDCIHPLRPLRPLRFEDTSRAGCALLLPRIAYSQNGTSNRRHSPPGPLRYLL